MRLRPRHVVGTRLRRRALGRVERVILVAVAALVPTTTLPMASLAEPAGVRSGCHAWSPVFQPILGGLAAGQIEVALPAYLPPLGPHVYVHVNIDEPPKTYQVTLTSSRSEHITKTSVLLIVHGNAGNHLPRTRPSPAARVNRKPLYLKTDAYGFAGLSWFYRSGGITYTVAAPAFVPLSTLIRITGSLVPAPLRRTPITNGTGKVPPACP
jgi:hypothetical protein